MAYIRNDSPQPQNFDEQQRWAAGESRESIIESREPVFVADEIPEQIFPVPHSADVALATWRWKNAREVWKNATPLYRAEALARVSEALQALHALEAE